MKWCLFTHTIQGKTCTFVYCFRLSEQIVICTLRYLVTLMLLYLAERLHRSVRVVSLVALLKIASTTLWIRWAMDGCDLWVINFNQSLRSRHGVIRRWTCLRWLMLGQLILFLLLKRAYSLKSRTHIRLQNTVLAEIVFLNWNWISRRNLLQRSNFLCVWSHAWDLWYYLLFLLDYIVRHHALRFFLFQNWLLLYTTLIVVYYHFLVNRFLNVGVVDRRRLRHLLFLLLDLAALDWLLGFVFLKLFAVWVYYGAVCVGVRWWHYYWGAVVFALAFGRHLLLFTLIGYFLWLTKHKLLLRLLLVILFSLVVVIGIVCFYLMRISLYHMETIFRYLPFVFKD